MVHIDILDERLDSDPSFDLLLGHVLGDLSGISSDSSNQAMTELFGLGAIEVVGENNSLLSSVFSRVENNDLSLFIHEFSSVGHWFIKILFLTILRKFEILV